MPKIMDIIAKETHGKSYHTQKYSREYNDMPAFDYDDDGAKIMKWKCRAETEDHKTPVDLTQLAKKVQEMDPYITYFLDGSRHVYKVDDISYAKKVYPVMAGQIGVGCCHRVNKKITPTLFYRSFVISLPDVANADGWDNDDFFSAKAKALNESSDELKKLKISFEAILPYSLPRDKQKGKLEDQGTACIQDHMIEHEKKMVIELVQKKLLNDHNYLLKDGSLEYKPMKRGDYDTRDLQRIKHNYKWVIGVSKSFNPESILDHTGKPNANYIADLPLYHRTPVALYENDNYLEGVQFGVWYLRIRDKSKTRAPFDGVIKVEKILMDEDHDKGLDSDEVDLISANLINERMPTCYGTDSRWANHLYPVFLTESYVKSKYLSSDMFLSLF